MDCFQVRCEEIGRAHVVEAIGEIDVLTATALKVQLHDCLEKGARPLMLDLTSTSFCDSQGLNVMVQFHKLTRHFIVVIPEEHRVHQTIVLSGLHTVLRLVPSVEDGLRT